jgi:hypothetical protein
MTPEQERKKEEALRESEHHHKHGANSVPRSNAELTDEELTNRMMGKEKGTSIIDQTAAGFALGNRKKLREKEK